MHERTMGLAPLLFAFILALAWVAPTQAANDPPASRGIPSGQHAPSDATPPVIHQLRVYEIFEHNKQAFHTRFREHAMRIMAKYDFKILAIWETQHNGRTEFAYLLQWPDRATLTDRWAKFMADQEWAAIKKRTGAQHGQMVGGIQDRVLEVQDYSPTHTFAVPVTL